MPRGPRLDEPLAVHHVWNRGIERGAIFRDDGDRTDFLARIETFVRAEHFAVYAWALMSNHFHLLTRTGNLGLSTAMRLLQGDYARYFNRRHQRSGHLFQNRFGSALVGDDTYFLALLSYIHLNPVRAGLVTGLDALANYPWSGHAALMGKRSASWQDSRFVLEQFGSNVAAARDAYRSFVAEALNTPAPKLDSGGFRRSRGLWEHVHLLRRGREDWSFDERTYGSSAFVSSVLAQLNGAGGPALQCTDAATFVALVGSELAQRTGLQLTELCSNSKRPRVVLARRALCYLAVRHTALPARQVALHLGVQPYTVLRCAARGPHALELLACQPADLMSRIV